MTRSAKLLGGVSDVRDRALGALRPGVEAFLLAAVALGCAQAGWSVFTPGLAGASASSVGDEQDATRLVVSSVESPFAPTLAQGDAQAHAVAALLSGVQLSGVRISDDPGRSGAILTLNDGAQHAFAMGQEISDGVTLTDVGAGYVIVSYAGGQQQIAMSTAPTFSFARAMMGLEQAPDAPSFEVSAEAPAARAEVAPLSMATEQPVALVSATPLETREGASDQVFAVASASSGAVGAGLVEDVVSADGWMQSMLAHIEREPNGQLLGWRVPESAPQAMLEAGLRAGDLVVAVNGAGPGNLVGALSAAQNDQVELAVERGAERLVVTIGASERS